MGGESCVYRECQGRLRPAARNRCKTSCVKRIKYGEHFVRFFIYLGNGKAFKNKLGTSKREREKKERSPLM